MADCEELKQTMKDAYHAANPVFDECYAEFGTVLARGAAVLVTCGACREQPPGPMKGAACTACTLGAVAFATAAYSLASCWDTYDGLEEAFEDAKDAYLACEAAKDATSGFCAQGDADLELPSSGSPRSDIDDLISAVESAAGEAESEQSEQPTSEDPFDLSLGWTDAEDPFF